jgi:hypothetical protein
MLTLNQLGIGDDGILPCSLSFIIISYLTIKGENYGPLEIFYRTGCCFVSVVASWPWGGWYRNFP